MNGINNNGNRVVEETHPAIEAEVAPDMGQVVREEVQRVVQEVLQDYSQRPLATVITTERNLATNHQREQQHTTICGLSRAPFWAMVVVVVVAIATGTTAALSSKEVPAVPTEAPTIYPSFAATSAADILYPDQMIEDLPAAPYNATLWIRKEDTFEWNSPEELLERHALATLYFGLNGENWSESTRYSWLSKNLSHCEWESVECNNRSSVISLDLSNRSLNGSMPAEIGRLSNLEDLVLSTNRITGQIPRELYYGLTKLTNLGIAGNLLSSFGAGLGRLTNLRVLFGGQNLFSSIPSEIGDLRSLQILNIVQGQLNSTLPTELERLTSLMGLFLAGNFLRGSLPNLSAFSNMTDLTLQNNAFSGQIPPLGGMTALTWMSLGDNRLEGSLPVGLDMVPLKYFSVANNQIGSTIPSELWNLSTLTSLRLENNALSGPLPTENNLTRLQFLYLSNNRLTSLPSNLGTITSLEIVEFAFNQLNITLPTELGRLLNLRIFDVRGNQLRGSVPETLDRWSRIRNAYFSSNNFTGGLENLFCSKSFTKIFEADCEVICNCCTDCNE